MYVLGMISIDAASSAQLKCTGDGVEHGGMVLTGGETGVGGHGMVAVGAVGVGGPLSAVKDVGSGKTAHL